MRIIGIFAFLLFCFSASPVSADRYTTLIAAKHLTLTTTKGTTYYYIVSADQQPVLHLGGDCIVLAADTFALSEVKSLRLKPITRYVLDEDSLRYGNDYTVDHGLLALRRTFHTGLWNSIVLPLNLTGQQIRETFGDDAMLARVRGIREGEQSVVEFETVSLDGQQIALEANQHYIIKPTREPDLPEGRTGIAFGDVRPKGPFYLISNATLTPKQQPKIQTLHNSDRSVLVSLRGSYTLRDGSSALNRKLAPGTYVFGDNGLIGQQADSVLLKAFTSWFADISSQPRILYFYIDGISEDLTPVNDIVDGLPRRDNKAVYDLQGRRIATADVENRSLRPGIYIINGKKYLIK